MKSEERLPLALFLLRLGVFVVMFVWTLDKFVNTAHATKVYERFYSIGGPEHYPAGCLITRPRTGGILSRRPRGLGTV